MSFLGKETILLPSSFHVILGGAALTSFKSQQLPHLEADTKLRLGHTAPFTLWAEAVISGMHTGPKSV